MTGTVYTETVVHSAPEAFDNDVAVPDGDRDAGRTAAGSPAASRATRVAIDDRVVLVETRERSSVFQEKRSMKLAERMEPDSGRIRV